jgi:hypothetical protein
VLRARACYVIAVRLVVLAFVLLAASPVRADDEPAVGWSVAVPEGWTRDAAASKTIVEQVKGAFFAGTPVLVRGDVFRGSEQAMLSIVTVETGTIDDPRKILEQWSEQTQIRNAGDRLIADFTRDGVQNTLQTAFFEGVHHFVHVACAGDEAACKRAIGSVAIGDGDEGTSWLHWIAIAGALLVAIGLVGWRIDLRRHR